MARKPREQWSDAYRRRIERAEEKARREGVPFSHQRARGHKGNEYQQRKERKANKDKGFGKLTRGQIAQMKSFGATDKDLQKASKLDPQRLRNFLRNQRRRANDPKFKAKWTLQVMSMQHPDVPQILFFYHSAAWR